MNDFLPYIYYSLPWLFVIGLSVAVVVGVGVGLSWPRLLVYPYLLVFFWVNSTTYGSLAVFASRSIYSRGSGVLLFGVLLWYVLGAWCCARVAAGFQRMPAPACNLRPWLLAWAVLLALHAGAALLAGVPVAEALAPSGFSNIVWMAPLISLMLLAFRTREQVRELGRFILLAGLARALFGLGRWAVLGGDPNNVYANMNALQIRLTFFDINDSLLCTLAFALAAIELFRTEQGQRMAREMGQATLRTIPARRYAARHTTVDTKELATGLATGQTTGHATGLVTGHTAGDMWRARLWRGVAWLTLAASALCVLLSYRRSAWIGFVLAAAVIMMRLAPRRRTQLMLAGLPLAGAALAFVAMRRLARAGADGTVGLLYDMQSRRFGPQSERLLELKLALADFLAHPLTGIGAWGRYSGYQVISWQNNQDGGLFLHSGVLHIALKTGIPGMVLLAGTICAFVLFARRSLRTLPPDLLGLGVAGAAGLAFMIPDFLIGTPFPQVRTTQMLALCLALPYLALAASAPRVQRPAVPHAWPGLASHALRRLAPPASQRYAPRATTAIVARAGALPVHLAPAP